MALPESLSDPYLVITNPAFDRAVREHAEDLCRELCEASGPPCPVHVERAALEAREAYRVQVAERIKVLEGDRAD